MASAVPMMEKEPSRNGEEPKQMAFQSFNCFGCAPGNNRGLRLRFTYRQQEARATVKLDRDYESFPGVLHGGVVSTILDESMGRAIFWSLGTPAVTVSLRVRFVSPMETGKIYVVRGRVTQPAGELVRAEAQLTSRDESTVLAVAAASFRIVDHRKFPRRAPALDTAEP